MIRLIRDLEPSDPALGLALDEALLESVRAGGADTVRLWVNGRAIVIGRSQEIEAEVDLEEAERLAIPVIRRISGGGAVYHHPGNLNVSLYLGDSRLIGGVEEAFRLIGGAIAAGLSELGIEVEPDGNRLICADKKIGGAAQARRGRALLYHTTLIVRPDPMSMERLLRALRPGYCTSAVPSHPFPTTSLAEIIGRELNLNAVGDTVLAGIVRFLDETAIGERVTEEEGARAEKLLQEKYGTERWNRQR